LTLAHLLQVAASSWTSLFVALTPLLQTAQPGKRWTLWAKRMDHTGTQYTRLHDLDPDCLVDDLKACWLRDKKLDVNPSLLTLRLVPCSPGTDPSEEQELAATGLSPRLTLREAGVEDGSSLLVVVVGTGTSARLSHLRRARCLTCVAALSPRSPHPPSQPVVQPRACLRSGGSFRTPCWRTRRCV
jgi:hypothetical protein